MRDDMELLAAERRRLELSLRQIQNDAVAEGMIDSTSWEPLTDEEIAEKARLDVEVPVRRRRYYISAGVPERYLDSDGRPRVGPRICRGEGCWEEVADDSDYVVEWSRRGHGSRWHRDHAPAAVTVLGLNTGRVIGNTTIPPRFPWPDDCMVQGGADGIVIGGGPAPYRTAFVEAFPAQPATFIRGEGKTVEDAEAACWIKYEQIQACPAAPTHGPWERRGYRNGGGFCGSCGMFNSKVFEPLPTEARKGDPA